MLITNLGGRCFGHFMIKHIEAYSNKFVPLYCPFGNMRFNNGFSDIYKIFDGTFYKEVFENREKIKNVSYTRRDNKKINCYETDSLLIFHNNMNDPNSIKKLKNRYKLFFDTLSKNEDIIFLYSLCEFDVDKTIDEIKESCEKLKKYIDINKLYIICSIADKNKNSAWWFDYQNPNFKEVFSERYIEIYGSNAGCMKKCCKKLLKKLIKS